MTNRRFWVDARAWLDDDFIGDCDLQDWDHGTRPSWLAVVPVRMIGLLSYGDYDNSCSVERSNNRVFWDTPEYASVPGVRRYSGSYGGVGILVASWAMAWVEPGTSPVWNGQSWTPTVRRGMTGHVVTTSVSWSSILTSTSSKTFTTIPTKSTGRLSSRSFLLWLSASASTGAMTAPGAISTSSVLHAPLSRASWSSFLVAMFGRKPGRLSCEPGEHLASAASVHR